MTKSDQVREHLRLQGVNTTVELSLDGGEQITVTPRGEAARSCSFSVAFRPWGTFILGFGGLYRLEPDSNVFDLVSTLATGLATEPDFSPIPAAVGLEEYSFKAWIDEGESSVVRAFGEAGWIALSNEENQHIWQLFVQHYSFHPENDASKWPGIKEPMPYVTWSVSRLRELYSTDRTLFQQFEQSSMAEFLQTLVELGEPTQEMFALDLNHKGFSFVPVRVLRQGKLDMRPVPLIPIHNYSVFVSPDLLTGLFCHPWEGSICAFGTQLIMSLVARPLPCFDRIVRSSGQEEWRK